MTVPAWLQEMFDRAEERMAALPPEMRPVVCLCPREYYSSYRNDGHNQSELVWDYTVPVHTCRRKL